MYGRLAVVCGYRPSEIDAMDMDEADEIFRYLQRHPSVHELMAAWVGFKPKEATQLPRDDPSVRLGRNILAGIEAAQAANPASNGYAPPGLMPDGKMRL